MAYSRSIFQSKESHEKPVDRDTQGSRRAEIQGKVEPAAIWSGLAIDAARLEQGRGPARLAALGVERPKDGDAPKAPVCRVTRFNVRYKTDVGRRSVRDAAASNGNGTAANLTD